MALSNVPKSDYQQEFTTAPIGASIVSCSATSKVALVDVVEVVMHEGKEITRPPETRKQYVNLDGSLDPKVAHPEFGRVIRLKARVDLIPGSPSCSLVGKSIYWYVEPDAENRTVLKGTNRAGLKSAGSGVLKHSTVTNSEGWTNVVEFYLSNYGGDKFEIYVTDDSGYSGGLSAGTYTVWRRLFFDVLEMKSADGKGKFGMPTAIVGKMQTAFDDVFIEFVDTGVRDLGDYVENFDSVDDALQWADKWCSKKGVPLKLHLCVVDQACPLAGQYGAKELTYEEDVKGHPFVSSSTIFPHDFGGHKWLLKIEYFNGVSWGQLSPSDVSLIGKRGRRRFAVELGLGPPSPKGKIRLRYLQAFGAGGWGGKSDLHLIICRGLYENDLSQIDADAQIAVACIHEPGHAMGLVDPSASWHYAVQPHHCKLQTCTMWFESAPGNERFHSEKDGDPGCRTTLRGTVIDKSAMESSWKFPRK